VVNTCIFLNALPEVACCNHTLASVPGFVMLHASPFLKVIVVVYVTSATHLYILVMVGIPFVSRVYSQVLNPFIHATFKSVDLMSQTYHGRHYSTDGTLNMPPCFD